MAVEEKKADAPAKEPADAKGKGKGKKKGEKLEDELSPEDEELKSQMELLVTRAQDKELEIRKAALQAMVTEIRTATSSMTSVPKPLKFLGPHYAALKESYKGASADATKVMLADVLSMLAMTNSEPGVRESLTFKLEGTPSELASWGHEYVRHLSGEIAEEYNERLSDETGAKGKAAELMPLIIDHMVPFFIEHNAEAEAIDLLSEVGMIESLVQHVDKTNCERVVMYLSQVAQYVPEPEDAQVLGVAVAALRKIGRHAEAMRLAVKLQNMTLVADILASCEDEMVKKQMAYMLARYGVRPEAEDELARIMDGAHTTEQYLELARDLDVVEPKTPEEVYKSHLEKRPASSSHIDSARQNLASTFVNGFVNVGFGADKLMLTEGNKWLYKNKEHGMMSAAASLGALLLWDVDGGLSQIDKFLYSSDTNIKAGALLAVGVLNSGVRNECDPALALLTEYVENKAPANIKMGATLGLGLAYAGSAREEVLELLMPLVADIETSLEVVAMAALSLGLTFVGTCNEDISQALLSVLMERDQQVLQKETLTRLICLAIGLLYLGKQQEVEVALELAKVLEGPVGLHCTLTLETCAYAGTGNVLKVQRLLELSGEHLAKDEEDEADGGGGQGAQGGGARPPERGGAGHRHGGHGGGARLGDVHPRLPAHAAVRRPARTARGAAGPRAALRLQPVQHDRDRHAVQALARPGPGGRHQRHHRHGHHRGGHQPLQGVRQPALARHLLRQGAGRALRGATGAGPHARRQGPCHALAAPPGQQRRGLPPGGTRQPARGDAHLHGLQDDRAGQAPLPTVDARRGDAPSHAGDGRRGAQAAARARARRAEGGRGGARGAAQANHGLPDAHHARAARHGREGRACVRRVLAALDSDRGRRHPAEEPQPRARDQDREEKVICGAPTHRCCGAQPQLTPLRARTVNQSTCNNT